MPDAMPTSDFIIVGAGTAGCVLANRLSADPSVSVTLLEAGGTDDADQFRVPIAGGQFFRTQHDWDFDTHAEGGLDQRRVYLPQARVVGGGSSINGMAYVRGNHDDFDSWGQKGWTYAELLPYFRRAEDNERGEDEYHGVGGPLRVSDHRAGNPSAQAFLEAALKAGFPKNPDFNGSSQVGFGTFQVTQRDGARASAATAYLGPALSRPNLRLETHIDVHRVTFEGDRAVGVVGSRAGQLVELRAAREVVVSAGAYLSPRVLMQSGIGPAEDLRALGLPVRLDQPEVGRNLQDHPHVWLSYAHDLAVSFLAASAPEHADQYARERRGMLTAGGPETGGFWALDGGPLPDLQFLCLPMLVSDQFLSPSTRHGIAFGASIMQPESRGQVSLFSADPTAKPKIVQNYLTTAHDRNFAIEGLRLSLSIGRQDAMRPYLANPVAAPESEDDATLLAFARQHTVSGHHPVGTCAIGSVLDTELRVHGVEGLRVVDASVMPRIIRGNTMAPVIALAERAADLILGAQPETHLETSLTHRKEN